MDTNFPSYQLDSTYSRNVKNFTNFNTVTAQQIGQDMGKLFLD